MSEPGIPSGAEVRPERDAQIAASVTDMRTPLARIELLASQLARAAATPASLSLASGIRQAVAELDRRVEQTLRSLVPDAPRCGEDRACQPALDEVCERLGPVLEARGIRCTPDASGAAVVGDPDRVRRAALALARAAGRLLPQGGALELRLTETDAGYGVALRVRTKAPALAAAGDALADAHSFALAGDAELRVDEAAANELRATLIFRRPTP